MHIPEQVRFRLIKTGGRRERWTMSGREGVRDRERAKKRQDVYYALCVYIISMFILFIYYNYTLHIICVQYTNLSTPVSCLWAVNLKLRYKRMI